MFFRRGVSKGKRIRDTLILLVGFLVIGLGALNLLAPVIDISAYQQDIIERISHTLQRKFHLDGKLFLKISLKPTLVTRNLAIENPDWSKTRHMLQAEQVEFGIDIVDFLLGKTTIDRLILKQASIHLEQSETGKNNWTFGAEKAAGENSKKAGPFRLDYALLEDVVIDYYAARQHRKFSIGHAQLRRSLRGRYRLDLDSKLGTRKFTLQASSNRWFDTRDIRPLNLTLDTEFGDNKLSASADIRQFMPRLEADIKMNSPKLDIDDLLSQLPAGLRQKKNQKETRKEGQKSDILQSIEPWLHKTDLVSLEVAIGRLIYRHYDFRGLSFQNRLIQDRSQKDGVFSVKARGRVKEIINKDRQQPGQFGAGDSGTGGNARISLQGQGNTPVQLINSVNVRLQAENFSGNRPQPYHVKQLVLDTDTDKRLQINGEIRYRDAPVRFSAQTGRDFFQQIYNQRMAHLDMVLETGASTVKVNSTSRELFKPIRKLHLRLAGNNLAEWSSLFGKRLPLLAKYKMETRLEVRADGIRAKQFALNTPASGIKGKFFYHYGKRPTLNARIENSRLALADLERKPKAPVPKQTKRMGTKPKEEKENKKAQDVMVIPRTDLMSLLSPTTDVNLEVRSSELAFKRISVTGMDLKARWQDRVFAVQVAGGRVSGGALTSDIYLTVVDKEAAGKIEMLIKQLDYGRLMHDLGFGDKMKGKADVSVHLVGFGRDLKAFLTDSDGIAEFVGEEGVLASKYLRLWGEDIVQQILPFNWFGREQTNMNCVVGRFDLTDGRLSSDSLLLDTETMTIAGTGAIDLNSEELAFELMPDPKNVSLISLATPVKIRGTLARPRIEPHALGTTWTIGSLLAGLANPAILITRFAKLGSLGENPCLAAIGKEEGKEQETSILKAFKDAVKFIQRPLDRVPDIE